MCSISEAGKKRLLEKELGYLSYNLTKEPLLGDVTSLHMD